MKTQSKTASKRTPKDPPAPIPTLDQIKATILQLLEQQDQNRYQIGEQYNLIVDNKLAEAQKYPNAPAWVAKNITQVPRSTLIRWGAVARTFTPDVTAKYGASNLATLISLANAMKATLPADPGSFQIGVPQKDGTITQTAFADCSVADLLHAMRAIKNGATGIPADVTARVNAMQQMIENRVGKHSHVKVVAREKGSIAVVSIEGIPYGMLMDVLSALQDLPMSLHHHVAKAA